VERFSIIRISSVLFYVNIVSDTADFLMIRIAVLPDVLKSVSAIKYGLQKANLRNKFMVFFSSLFFIRLKLTIN
jgi:hypothetical protein